MRIDVSFIDKIFDPEYNQKTDGRTMELYVIAEIIFGMVGVWAFLVVMLC